MTIGTAGDVVTKAMRLLTVLDQEENPTTAQLQQGTEALSDMLRHTFAEATSSFQVELVWYLLPAGRSDFTIGKGKDIDRDIKIVRAIRAGDYDAAQGRLVTRRELRPSNLSHVFQVMVSGDTAVRYVTQENIDGSITVTLWPAPASVGVNYLVEIGKRVPILSAPTDDVPLPPDATFQAQYLLAKTLRSQYGISQADVADVMALADKYELEWTTVSRQNNFVRVRRRPA